MFYIVSVYTFEHKIDLLIIEVVTQMCNAMESAFLSEMLTSHATLAQTRNLLRIAMFNIIYIRGLFPDKYFHDKYVPALGKCHDYTNYLKFRQNMVFASALPPTSWSQLLWETLWRSQIFMNLYPEIQTIIKQKK